MRVIVKPKVFFFRASFFRWRQNLLLYHMYHFWSRWWEQSRPEPYLFLSTSIFAGQNDQLRLKSSKTVLKAFQLIFPWLKMKWKTLCISNLDSWVDQKKHLNKDAQKKMLWSRDVRWPASIFPSSHFTFSSSKKLNFLIQSNIRQVPNILVFLSSCTRPTSFACFWQEERCPCSSSNVVAKKNVWSGRRISRRAIHNYFLFLRY